MSLERRIRNMFEVPRKGETYELRSGLVSQYAHERKDAIRRTIAAMTLGKDVSSLFPDVLKNIATPDLDQKKLVYLYFMNYSKTNPDLCILAVNTFVRDSEDPNPLVRALAIRTMGTIRVDKMVDYMEEPLRKTLEDDSPYVRKTAAICVAKLFDLNPTLCVENGFLEMLQNLVGDSNPMVIANAISALEEIQETAPETNALAINSGVLNKILMALNECTEWGRISILTVLSKFETSDATEARHLCERVVPQFQHANPSVVLAAINAVLAHVKDQDAESQKSLLQKMAPPLVSLVSSAPEVQYVALRNINLILQKYPEILRKEVRVFFCKYNDPLYLKLEKLDVMVRLANERNVDQLLAELKEYSLEIDMDFVRRAVKAIGQCALNIDKAAERCTAVLLDLLNTKVDYVVHEAIPVLRDILRRYPNAVSVIPAICEISEELEEPEAVGAFIWIVGEYAEKIANATELLSAQISIFKELESLVQLQLITAAVKLYLKKSQPSIQELVHKVLQIATTECDNADIRDRAFIYWRLLSGDAKATKQVILAKRPPIGSAMETLPTGLLDSLLTELSTLASVYHKPASSFITMTKVGGLDEVQQRALEEQRRTAAEIPVVRNMAKGKGPTGGVDNSENLLDISMADDGATSSPGTPVATTSSGSDLNDLIFSVDKLTTGANSNGSAATPPPQQPSTNGSNNDKGSNNSKQQELLDLL